MSQFENVESILPLAPVQEGMLYHTVAAPKSGVYITQICVELTGHLDPSALRAAWEATVAGHSAMRASFFWDGLDAPVQVIREKVDIPWQELDWRERGDAALPLLLAEERRSGFDL